MQKWLLMLLLISTPTMAEWQVITHIDTSNNTNTQIAYTENKAGYRLHLYRDSVGSIRMRFSLNNTLDMFAKRHCPTYEIDSHLISNRSINDAPCLAESVWSEFIFGYIENNKVASKQLNALINGDNITFRFMLENGVYEEIRFSLASSKRTILRALGTDIALSL